MTNCPTCDSPAPNLHPAVQHEGEVQPCDDEFHDEYRQRTGESLADMSRRLYGDRTTGPAHYPLIPLRRPRVTPPDRHPEDTMSDVLITIAAKELFSDTTRRRNGHVYDVVQCELCGWVGQKGHQLGHLVAQHGASYLDQLARNT